MQDNLNPEITTSAPDAELASVVASIPAPKAQRTPRVASAQSAYVKAFSTGGDTFGLTRKDITVTNGRIVYHGVDCGRLTTQPNGGYSFVNPNGHVGVTYYNTSLPCVRTKMTGKAYAMYVAADCVRILLEGGKSVTEPTARTSAPKSKKAPVKKANKVRLSKKALAPLATIPTLTELVTEPVLVVAAQ